MARLLSVSRAASIVGVPRAVIQKQIREGELTSFEGKVNLTELTSLYPDTEFEHDDMLERIEEILSNALRRARYAKFTDLVTPDTATLAARVSILSKELTASKIEIYRHENLMTLLKDKLSDMVASSDQNTTKVATELLDWLEHTRLNMSSNVVEMEPLASKDNFLRIMAAQVHIKPSNHEFFVEGKNSILESGLSAGFALDYGCSSGNCGKCKAKLLSGRIEKIKHHDYVINESEKANGYFLMCAHTAVTDVELEAEEAGSENDIPVQNIFCRVKKIEEAGNNISVLTLKAPRTERLRFFAGQKVKLSHADFEPQILPIASCPCDDRYIQFHIKQDASPLHNHIRSNLKANDTVGIEGPEGHFVLQEDSTNSIIFIAENTGFAPIKSLIEHALTLETAEFLHLYWLADDSVAHYLSNHCRAWNDALDNFVFTPVKMVSPNPSNDDYKNYLIPLIKDHPDLINIDFYIAGSEELVETANEFLRAQGIGDNQITSEVTLD